MRLVVVAGVSGRSANIVEAVRLCAEHQQQRQRLVALERKVYARTATDPEKAEYKALSRLLTSSLQARVG
ncbi:hypothetical protein AB0F77_31160 [Streptomyces sp. NPDC026672]|uniref:hypothetical protein n=1 Tax=Actinomycetes TaxID=1760 RepID=UPI0033E752F0